MARKLYILKGEPNWNEEKWNGYAQYFLRQTPFINITSKSLPKGILSFRFYKKYTFTASKAENNLERFKLDALKRRCRMSAFVFSLYILFKTSQSIDEG